MADAVADAVAMLALCGWTRCAEGAVLVRCALGECAVPADLPAVAGGWTNADSRDPDEPVGTADSLVRLRAPAVAEVQIAPGSQGLPPPSEVPGATAITVAVGPGDEIVLDGRCWYRALAPGVVAQLWRRAPDTRAPGPRGSR